MSHPGLDQAVRKLRADLMEWNVLLEPLHDSASGIVARLIRDGWSQDAASQVGLQWTLFWMDKVLARAAEQTYTDIHSPTSEENQ